MYVTISQAYLCYPYVHLYTCMLLKEKWVHLFIYYTVKYYIYTLYNRDVVKFLLFMECFKTKH